MLGGMKTVPREILIELSEEQLQQVEAIAEVEGRSRRAQISRIIAEWLKQETAKIESGERTGKK